MSKGLGRFILLVLFVMVFLTRGFGQVRRLVTSQVDDSQRSSLPASVHPLAKATNDVGPVASSTVFRRMVLVLGAGTEQDQALQSVLAAQQDPKSPDFHHWLTPEEFSQRFGPSEQDVAAVRTWLSQRGFSIDSVSRSRRWIEFTGTSQQVESAFQTQMRQYRVGGKLHLANASNVSIPSALAPVVRGVLSLHDFRRTSQTARQFEVRRNSSGQLVPVDPTFTVESSSSVLHYLAPGDFNRIYNVSPLLEQGLDGSGQTIAIVGRQNIELGDVHVFRQTFGLPVNDPTVIVNGPDPGYLVSGDGVESTLDVEWAGAVAPGANILLVVSSSTVTTDGIDLSAAYAVDNNLSDVLSVSYGQCEQYLGPAENAFYSSLWKQASAQGISVVVSTGDNGAAGCDKPDSTSAAAGPNVNGLASTPYNTAVGGTAFRENGSDSTYWGTTNNSDLSSVVGYIPEKVWNETCAAPDPDSQCEGLWAGSGGVSSIYDKPAWQSGTGVPADSKRDLPDLSLNAAAGHDGFLFCMVAAQCIVSTDENGLPTLLRAGVVGGTSVSAPSFAGMLAIIDQKTGSRQGLANPTLYRLAASQQSSDCNSSSIIVPTATSNCTFYDITFGNNDVPGLTGTTASAGYDLATGLGSVNALNLANAWNNSPLLPTDTTLVLTSTSGHHGDPTQLSLSVAAQTGTAVPTGNVALMADKYGAVATVPLSDGTFSGTVSSFPGGQYNLIAHYAGDGTFQASDSAPVAMSISPEESTISLGAYTYAGSPMQVSSVPYGNYLYFHVQVTGISGMKGSGGTVTFFDGTSELGTLTLASTGQGEFVSGGFSVLGAVTCLTVGQHTITASFSGDDSLLPSTSPAVQITITKSTPFVFFPNLTPVSAWPASQPLPLFIYVGNDGPILPTGTIQFLDNGSPIGPLVTIAPLSDGARVSASATVTLSPGSHIIDANYSGDSVYNASNTYSAFGPLHVTATAGTGVATQTTVTAPATVGLGQAIDFAFSVTASDGSTPTGNVQLYGGQLGYPSVPVQLVNGKATTSFSWGFAGPWTFVAQYSGDSSHAVSVSTPLTVTIQKGTPILTLTSNSAYVATGKKVSLYVNMVPVGASSGSVPGEKVQFYDSVDGGAQQPLGAPQVLTFGPSKSISYVGVLSIVLPKGTHTVTAQFLGDSSLNPTTSNSATITVADPGFQLSVSSQSVAVSAGASGIITLTATPLGGFQASATATCTGAPYNATCTVTPSTLPLNGSGVSATVTVKTLGPSTAQAKNKDHTEWNFVFAAAFAMLLSVGIPRRKSLRRGSASILPAIFVAISVLSCGGGGSSSTPPPPPGPGMSATSTSLTTASPKVAVGEPTTVIAKVTSSAASISGTITFYEDNNQIGQGVALTNGQAQLQLSGLQVGTHVFTAKYSGDSNNYSSNSNSWQQVITGSTRINIVVSAGGQDQTTGFQLIVQ